MNLFSKDKELIFKIVNGIFLIWFIAAVILTANSIIDYVIREPIPTYQEFIKNEGGMYPEKGTTESEMKDIYNQNYANQNIYALRFLLTSMANVVIVGGAIYILNRTPKKKEDK